MLVRDITLFGDPATFSIMLRKDHRSGELGLAFAGISFCVLGRWLGNIDAVSTAELILSVLDSASETIRRRLEEFGAGPVTSSLHPTAATGSDIMATYTEMAPAIPGLKGVLGVEHMVMSEAGSRYRIDWECESMDYSDYIVFATPSAEGIRLDFVHKSGKIDKSLHGFVQSGDVLGALTESARFLREQLCQSQGQVSSNQNF